MHTVGELLKEARNTKSLTLEDVEKVTKIRAKYLRAIESDLFTDLPSLSYAKGFVKNYSEFLGLNSKKMLAFFRRQTTDTGRSGILPKSNAEPLNRTLFQLTPGKFIMIVIVLLIGVFFLYFAGQFQALNKPPLLVIDSPSEHSVTAETRIDVIGKTDPDATVTINGVSVLVRGDGKFFDQVSLEPGVNTLTVTATSRLGKTSTKVLDVGAK